MQHNANDIDINHNVIEIRPIEVIGKPQKFPKNHKFWLTLGAFEQTLRKR